MRRNVLIALNSIYLLFAGLVVGVPLGVGAISAPLLFRQLDHDQVAASAITGRSLEASGLLCIASLSIMLVVAAFEISYRRRANTKRLLVARLVVNLVALLANVYLTESLLPMMKVRRELGDMRMLMAMHGYYQSFTWIVIALGAVLIVMTQAINIGPRRDGGHSRQV